MCCSLRLIYPGVVFLACLLAAPGVVSGQGEAPVEVRRVQFQSERDDWLRVSIALRGNRNLAPDARNDRFTDRVKVRCVLAYEREDGFDFYRSELELVAIEQNATEEVSFLLPGILVKRDRLRGEPFAWLVELEVRGRPLPLQEEGISPSIRGNPTAAQSLKNRAELEAGVNDGILIPAYLGPPALLSGNDTTAYIRREPETR